MDRGLLRRVGVGPAEAVAVLVAAIAVLLTGGWTWGQVPDRMLLALASGAAFASVLGQLTNADACRSETRWIGSTLRRRNPLLPLAVASELVLLLVFLGVPALSSQLGGAIPTIGGWLLAMLAVPAVVIADTLDKLFDGGRPRSGADSDGSQPG